MLLQSNEWSSTLECAHKAKVVRFGYYILVCLCIYRHVCICVHTIEFTWLIAKVVYLVGYCIEFRNGVVRQILTHNHHL